MNLFTPSFSQLKALRNNCFIIYSKFGTKRLQFYKGSKDLTHTSQEPFPCWHFGFRISIFFAHVLCCVTHFPAPSSACGPACSPFNASRDLTKSMFFTLNSAVERSLCVRTCNHPHATPSLCNACWASASPCSAAALYHRTALLLLLRKPIPLSK